MQSHSMKPFFFCVLVHKFSFVSASARNCVCVSTYSWHTERNGLALFIDWCNVIRFAPLKLLECSKMHSSGYLTYLHVTNEKKTHNPYKENIHTYIKGTWWLCTFNAWNPCPKNEYYSGEKKHTHIPEHTNNEERAEHIEQSIYELLWIMPSC